MQLLQPLCPQHIPALLLHDPDQSVLVMEFLPPPHQKLLYGIRQGQVRGTGWAPAQCCNDGGSGNTRGLWEWGEKGT
jgi:hypothetical protein